MGEKTKQQQEETVWRNKINAIVFFQKMGRASWAERMKEKRPSGDLYGSIILPLK